MQEDKSKRRFLHKSGLTLTSLLAGCASIIQNSSESDKPPSTGANSTICDTKKVQTPPPSETDAKFDPREYPEIPNPLTKTNIGTFVERFERSYQWNELLKKYEDITSLDVDILDDPIVKRDSGGYIVHVRARQQIEYEKNNTSQGTPIILSGMKEYRVGYFVTKTIIKRSEGSGETPTNPRNWGNILVCLP